MAEITGTMLVFSLALAVATPAFADETRCPEHSTSFCVVYKDREQNIWSNFCALKQQVEITVLYQGLCTDIPNAQ